MSQMTQIGIHKNSLEYPQITPITQIQINGGREVRFRVEPVTARSADKQ
jgi:hypothetical protein